ncbi:sialate O-acetylesterase [Marinimicrobium sp. C2-29]|uniref:sialate O-acetylesterase n=1 Tax=Marinimicrobium sp. C2-29 TaxID=3139825 RepID=UPI003139BA6F
MSPIKPLLLAGALLATLPSFVHAEVRLPQWISDGVVLQRDTPVPVWGWADPDEAVTLTFQGERYQTRANEEGRWEVTLPELKAGGPYEMHIRAENEIRLDDVLVGDVWLASGQSNMELPMGRVEPMFGAEIEQADHPRIRYFEVPDRYQFKHPEQDLEGGQWLSITPDNIRQISAVGYFFARDLQAEYEVPIGIINAALGGSPAESWLSAEALKAFPEHLKEARRFQDDARVAEIIESDQARSNAWYQQRDEKDKGFKDGEFLWADPALDHSDWDTVEMPGYWPEEDEPVVNGVWWLRKTIEVPEDWAGQPAMLVLGRMVDADTTFLNGEPVGETTYQYPPRRYRLPEGVLKAGENTIAIRLTNNQGRAGFFYDKDYQLEWQGDTIDLTGEWHRRQGAELPALEPQTFVRWKPLGLYNGMIAPLTDYPLKGVIWYQGESNVGRAEEYAELFPALINNWRDKWDQEDLPFLFVQLANFLEAREQPGDSDWARLREAQLTTLNTPHTGMAVAIDVGEWNDIHPLDKKTVGERLAQSARAVAYGESDGEPDAVGSGPIYQSMKVKGKRVHLRFDAVGSGLASCDGEPLQQFAIAGEDRDFVWAEAKIRGNQVRVWSDDVRNPKAVRYAWADNPEGANLCNREGLPASPFRTDDW